MSIPRAFGFYGNQEVDPQRLQYVRQAANRGLTLGATQKALRDAGIPLRRQSISEIRNEALGIQRARPVTNALRREFRPGAAIIQDVKEQMRTEYRYRIRLKGFDPETGPINIPVTFGDDRLLTRAEIEARSEDIFQKALSTDADRTGYWKGVEMEEIELTEVSHRIEGLGG